MPPPGLKLALDEIYALKGDVGIRELAGCAGWTKQWLSTVFKRWIGAAPQVVRDHVKFNSALKELEAGVKPVSVAQDTGYFDQSHLNRSFKKHTGVTPAGAFKFRRYRKTIPLQY